MTLYKFLVFEKHYTENEALETVVRFENSMNIPFEVKKDIREYYKKYYAKPVKD